MTLHTEQIDLCESCTFEAACKVAAQNRKTAAGFLAGGTVSTTKCVDHTPRAESDVARTSQHQVSGLVKRCDWTPDSVILDYGAGKYDDTALALRAKGCHVVSYDPYARSLEQTTMARHHIEEQDARGGFDVVILSNVLNVIKSDRTRYEVLQDAWDHVGPGGQIRILIHEGDRSGVGRETRIGTWQENRVIREYLPEVRDVVGKDVEIRRGVMIATRRTR